MLSADSPAHIWFMSAENRNRQPKGVSAGGQFAPEAKAEDTAVALSPTVNVPEYLSVEEFEEASPERRAEMVQGLKSLIPENTDVYYISYDEQLSDEQIDLVLAGQDGSAYEDFLDNSDLFGDESTENVAREALADGFRNDRTDIDWEDLDTDEKDQLIDLVQERNTSDPIADLTRNTHPQLMRTSLSTPSYDKRLGEAWSGDALYAREESETSRALVQRRRDIVADKLAEHGVDTALPANREAIAELIDNGPYNWHEGVSLDVIFHAKVNEVSASQDGPSKLAFTDPYVVLIDRINGSGHDVKLQGTVSKRIPEAEKASEPETRVFLDDDGRGGYGWDQVAGVVKSAYAVEIERVNTATVANKGA